MSDYREDVRLSKDILDRVIDTYRKIRNTLRFLLGNLADFDPARHRVPVEKMEDLDLAALAALNRTLEQVKKHYEKYEFHLVSSQVCDAFCINALSEYYLDVQKDVLYCDRPDSPRRRSAQTAFLLTSKALARVMAPLVSFTAEEVWQALREQNLLDSADGAESVFLNPFPQPVHLPSGKFFVMADFLALKRRINEAVEKARQAGAVKGAGDAHLHITLHAGHRPFVDMTAETLAAIMGAAKATVKTSDQGEPAAIDRVEAAPGAKCGRCWIWRPLSSDGVCARCAEAEAENRKAVPQPS
jgi:isoleucyl-tRNA synthetase